MKFNRYKNIVNSDLEQLDQVVNSFIANGCLPVGGMSVINMRDKIIFSQTVMMNDDSNDFLGLFEPFSEPSYLVEVRNLAAKGEKLAAVKLYMDNAQIGLKEAKDWVDANC